MLLLTIRTDKPEAEIGLYTGSDKLAYVTWQAHRQLAETLHQQLTQLLRSVDKDWTDIEGIVAYEGPGSFTGLRIGMSVANALAYSYAVPIRGSTGEDWIHGGIKSLLHDQGTKQVLPQYGAPVHITPSRK